MNAILVIKLRYIGDVLLATPVIRALRHSFPNARIVMAVNQGTEAVLQYNPDLSEVLVLDRSSWTAQWRLLQRIRAFHFDCVIDLTDGDRSALLAAWSGAPIRIGFNHENRWRGRLYSHVVSAEHGGMHMIDYHLQALHPLGIPAEPAPPILRVGKTEEEACGTFLRQAGLENRPWIMMHPGARYWFKRWPVERFARLNDQMSALGFRVVLIGSSQEQGLAEDIQRLAHDPPVSMVGRTRLLELAALMRHCALFVGNDGGPMHMAAAMGVPVVALFGPTDPVVWGPVGSRAKVLYKGLDCRACFHPGCFRGEDSCLRQISVEEVSEAVVRCLEARCDSPQPFRVVSHCIL